MRDLVKFDGIKKFAYAIGTRTEGDYASVLKWVFAKKHMDRENGYGDMWEVVVLFILGVFARSAKERGIKFWVLTDPDLDKRKVDLQVNYASIQLKFGWRAADIDIIAERLLPRLIFVVNAPYPEPCDPADIFRDILKAAGFSDEEIDREVEENAGFDAVYECWAWFTRGIV